MNKNIWIVNEYAGSPYHGMEFRHYYIGKELVKKGYNVDVITSSYSHLFKKLPTKSRENIDGVNYYWLKTLNYGNSHNRKRVLKWVLFMIKCFFLPFFVKNKPNVIMVSPMAPFPILPAWFLSKIYKAKLIYEVKDIWPLSLVELGNISPRHSLIRVMRWFEKFALKKSDEVVSNLQNYGEHIKELGINRGFTWVSNGVDLDELSDIEPLSDEVKNLIPKNKFIVGYTGTIGVANSLDSFLASYSNLNNKDICFVVVGDGQEKSNLKEKYKKNNDIVFVDAIGKRQVQSMLSLFDVCFLGWNTKEIYKYGTSANKIFDYMYSSKPILNAFSGGGDLVQLVKCGKTVEANNSKEIAKAIDEFYAMDKDELKRLGDNGKNYVLEHFTYEKLANKLTGVLEK